MARERELSALKKIGKDRQHDEAVGGAAYQLPCKRERELSVKKLAAGGLKKIGDEEGDERSGVDRRW
ncbi:hypothetical protein ACOSP7_031782 [Xanthoceras sorbifolium]